MDRKHIENILNAGECPTGNEELIIAFATGELKSEDERINALIHILLCDSCRFTYEDILAMEQVEDDTLDLAMPEISFKIDKEYIIPITESLSPSVMVLSSGKSRSAGFSVVTHNADYNILAINAKTGVELSVECKEDNAKFYLISPNKLQTVFPYKGKAIFESLRPGRYILAKDMKDFVFVEIK